MHQVAHFLSSVMILPYFSGTGAAPGGSTLFDKQFGQERSGPLPCLRQLPSRVSAVLEHISITIIGA